MTCEGFTFRLARHCLSAAIHGYSLHRSPAVRAAILAFDHQACPRCQGLKVTHGRVAEELTRNSAKQLLISATSSDCKSIWALLASLHDIRQTIPGVPFATWSSLRARPWHACLTEHKLHTSQRSQHIQQCPWSSSKSFLQPSAHFLLA